MKESIKILACMAIIGVTTSLHATILGDRLALGIASHMSNMKWDIDQSSTLKASPFTTTKSAYGSEFSALGFGLQAAIESTRPGFTLAFTGAITFDSTSKATIGTTEVKNFTQFNFTAIGAADFGYKIGAFAPFVSPGLLFSGMGPIEIDGKITSPNYSYTSVGLLLGGGLKVFLGERFYARASYSQQLVELVGKVGQPEESTATATYDLSRKLTSGYNILISVSYIFGEPEGSPEKTEVAPEVAAPAAAEPVKPAEIKKAQGKKKGK